MLQIPFIESGADVKAAAKRHKWNLEDAARRLRYEFFAKVVEQGRATRIAVAHTMDDQAETVLARILRGSGPSGLAAIHPVAGHIVRPLLGFRRSELRKYLADLGQSWREDSTNRDISRQRARIRENLLPLLERDFSPRAVEHLANLARLFAEEGRFWDALIEDRFTACVVRKAAGASIAIRDLLSPLPLTNSTGAASQPLRSVTERLIRRLYQEVRGDRLQLASAHIEQVIRLATVSSSGRRIELPGGVRVARNFDNLLFSREKAAPQESRTIRKAAPKTERHPPGGTGTW
jgi:tRNA(Ile)-lysidine synthase